MVFHRKQKHIKELNIVINGTKIDRVESFNFLGLTINETLSWAQHVDIVKKKVSKVIGIFYRLKNIFPMETMMILYKSLIASYLNYGLLLWGTESDKVLTLQKKAIHLISNSSYIFHTNPLFIQHKLLKIGDLFKLKLLKLYYKLSYNLLPSYFDKYREIIEHEPARVLRINYIHPPLIRRVYAECSPLLQLIKLINDLRNCSPLTHLINCSLQSGIFPDELKLARVVPIFKAGDPAQVSNYRPISVLTTFSKIIEKIVYNHLLDFLSKNEALYEYQFGFRPSHSTQQAIITLVDRITKSLDNGNFAVAILLDLKKAFDTVDHKILLKKLYAYGIRGIFLKWFESYLSGRTQYVVFDGVQSETHRVDCGVPQGSILGPLLFILNMNDICNVSKLMFTILYADDTCVLLRGTDLSKLIKLINSELNLLSTWFKSNKLSLNTGKTFYMVFHRARLKPNTNNDIIMDGNILTKVNSAKYLGVIIDHKLNWIEHIAYVKNKISKGIGIIYKARSVLSKTSLVSLYYSYVYPYLTYCIEAWGCAMQTHLLPLFLLQKKIIRLITFSPYLAHTGPIFLNLQLLPLEKIFFSRVGLVMFKCSNNMLPNVISNLYIKNNETHSHFTRNSNLLRIPKGTPNFTTISARVWNEIVTKILMDQHVSISKFKTMLKSYLLVSSFTLSYTK